MEDYENFKINEYKHWNVFLHKNQYFLGRVYIWAKREDAVDFMHMNSEENQELFDIGFAVNRVLNELFQPDLMNYAALGNISAHLHLHVIPRYKSSRQFDGIEFVDERWNKNYAPYNYDFKIPESTLLKIRDAIKEEILP